MLRSAPHNSPLDLASSVGRIPPGDIATGSPQPRQPSPSTGEARRRTGCWPCKKAHNRCQEQRPSCSRCQRLGLPCNYSIKLLWKEDAAQRGICLGREGVWSRSGSAAKKKKAVKGDSSFLHFFLDTAGRRPIFLNTTYAHFGDYRGWADLEESSVQWSKEALFQPNSMADSYYESLLARPRPGSTRQIPHKEAYLLDYFTSFICPNCSLSPTHNPYLRYIVPMALTYEPLHYAILSVAANQMRLLNDNRYEREAWAYKNHAMKGLQTSIDRGEVGWQFVATVLMLCFYDISDGCDVSWMTHLKGGMSVLEHVRRTGSAQSEAESLSKFFVMYFVAHQIMGLTAQGTESGLPQHHWLEDDSMEEIDVLMGCSRGLLSLIDKTSAVASRYTALSHDRALTDKELGEICSMWEELSTDIQNIPQVAPSTAINKENLVRVAESKRTTALIYLNDRFSPFLPSETSFTPTSKPDLVPKLVSQLSGLPTTPTLLWPLFVLGRSSPEHEDYRRFVLDRLIEMQRLRNLGSVRLTRRLVEDEYRRWDLNMEGGGPQYEIGVRGKWVSLA